MKQNKFIFGITGGSGTGKTTVSGIFKKLGAEVIDCDLVSRIVTDKDSPCLYELCEKFGREIINEDGTLNRRLLGEFVFSDSDKLRLLGEITHKYIYEYITDAISKSDAGIIGIDGAVIIGSPVEELCEAMVSVLSEHEKRVERIVLRDDLTEATARARINSQKIDNFYLEKSDFVLYNNSTLEILENNVREVWEKLNAEKRKKDAAVL